MSRNSTQTSNGAYNKGMKIQTRISRAFPPPPYLAMPASGIDIGTGSVKSITFSTHTGLCALGSFSSSELEEGVIVGGDIEKPEVLIEVLRSIRLRERIRFAHASLPERKAYLYETFVPKAEKQNLHSAVEFSLESHVPIPPTEAVFDFEIVNENESGTTVAVTVYARRVVDAYASVFEKAGITLRSFEIESQAAGRAIIGTENNGRTVMLVDFGKKSTRVAIFDRGVVGFTATIDVGGETLTSAVIKSYNVSAEEAEKIKNEKGFLEGGENRELFEALMTTVSVLKDEILRRISFWDTPPEAGVTRKSVDALILVGGNANLKGLPEYLSRALKLPVEVGNVWQHAFSLGEYVPHLPRHQSLEYATTVGLALRSCNARIW